MSSNQFVQLKLKLFYFVQIIRISTVSIELYTHMQHVISCKLGNCFWSYCKDYRKGSDWYSWWDFHRVGEVDWMSIFSVLVIPFILKILETYVCNLTFVQDSAYIIEMKIISSVFLLIVLYMQGEYQSLVWPFPFIWNYSCNKTIYYIPETYPAGLIMITLLNTLICTHITIWVHSFRDTHLHTSTNVDLYASTLPGQTLHVFTTLFHIVVVDHLGLPQFLNTVDLISISC